MEQTNSSRNHYLARPKEDVHFRYGIIKEFLAKGLNWLSDAFLIYQRIRFFETDGDFGFCVEGYEAMGKAFGFSAEKVKDLCRYLRDQGLIEHVWCDERVYRNKTKIWLSTVRLAGASTAVDAIKVLDQGKKNQGVLQDSPFALKKAEEGRTTDGSPETGDGSPETGDGSPETGDGSPARTSVLPQSEKRLKIDLKETNIYKDDSLKNPFKEEFVEVWKLYPNKKGKSSAEKAYIKARKSGVSKDVVVNGIKAYKTEISLKNLPMKFVKYGSTWFNQAGWEDEYEKPSQTANVNTIYSDNEHPTGF